MLVLLKKTQVAAQDDRCVAVDILRFRGKESALLFDLVPAQADKDVLQPAASAALNEIDFLSFYKIYAHFYAFLSIK